MTVALIVITTTSASGALFLSQWVCAEHAVYLVESGPCTLKKSLVVSTWDLKAAACV